MTDQSALNDFQLGERFLHLLSNFCRDLPTPGDTIRLDVSAHACLRRKITARDRPALGAAELLPEPLRHPVPSVHRSIEFVDLFIKGIPPECHPEEHPNDPR